MSNFCTICWTSIISNDTTNNPIYLGGSGSEETNASLYVKSVEHRTIFQSLLAVFEIEDPRIWVKKPSKFCFKCGHQLTRVSHLKEKLKLIEMLIKCEEEQLKQRLKLRTVAITSKNGDKMGKEEDDNWWELPDSLGQPFLEDGDGRNSKETKCGVPADSIVAHDEDEKTKDIEEKILSPAAALAVPIEEESGYDSALAFLSTSKSRIPFQIRKRRQPPEELESRESSSLGRSHDEPNESLPKRSKRIEAREEGESSSSSFSLNLLSSRPNPIRQTQAGPFRLIQVKSNYEETKPMDNSSNQDQDHKNKDETSALSKGRTISIIPKVREEEVPQFFLVNSPTELKDGDEEQKQVSVSTQDEREAVESLLKLRNFMPKNEPNKESKSNGTPLSTPKLVDEDLLFTSNNERKERKGGPQKSSNNSTKKIAKLKLKNLTPSPSSGIGEQKECPTCLKIFRTTNLLRFHLNGAHKLGNLYCCPICERPYYGKKAPRRHIWTHYSAREKEEAAAKGEKVPSCWEKEFMCDKCPSAFTTNSDLLKHQKQIHEEVVERQACEKCGALVKNLAGHMRQSHPKKEDFRFVCLECEERFINSARLRQHKLSKHGEGKMIKCERCEELFKTRRELTVHVNSKHLKIMPYKCEFCGMDFARKMSWTRHIQGVHKDKKGAQTGKQNDIKLNKKSRRISVK
ncbi:unnamed protein product [Orchesella dallaii]|uniref:C2H2-type domain-containing protein n=1 Tax=Orchesella dallaii TaxID=48710 RepID=A0ABP1PM91_9HEXA